MVGAYNRYIKMRASYMPLFCTLGQSVDCIAPTLVGQSRQVGTDAERAAIMRVVEAFDAGTKEAAPALLAFRQWQDQALQPRK